MRVTGYQTLEDLDNIDEVETNGPYKCTRGDAWLGHGYYFWDTDIYWAHDWGRNSYEKREKGYIICQAEIDLNEEVFDLTGNVGHQLELSEALKILRNDPKMKGKPNPTIPSLIEFLKQNTNFPYSAIRAHDNPPGKVLEVDFTNKRKEYIVIQSRVQICLINKRNLNLPFEVHYPKKYRIDYVEND